MTIERRLPSAGKLLVKPSDKVSPEDIVGEAEISGGFRKINLAQILGISTSSVIKVLVKKEGEVVYKGEPLARSRRLLGLRSKVYLSPVDGVVEAVEGGEITIRFAPSEIQLSAGFSGVVESVTEGEQVSIRTTAARILGAVGAGRERFAHLKVVGKPGEFLLPQHLDSTAAGKVVAGGAVVTADTIEKALAIGVKGLITGGVNSHETLGWSEGSDLGLTIVAIEGYGFHPIGDDVYEALTKYDGQYVAISGEKAEVLVSVQGEPVAKTPPAWRELKLGDTVRVVAGADLGKAGPAEAVSASPVKLESGLTTKVVSFKCEGEKIISPWQNLEIIRIKT